MVEPKAHTPRRASGLAVYNVVAMFSDTDLRDPKFSRRDFLNLAGDVSLAPLARRPDSQLSHLRG